MKDIIRKITPIIYIIPARTTITLMKNYRLLSQVGHLNRELPQEFENGMFLTIKWFMAKKISAPGKIAIILMFTLTTATGAKVIQEFRAALKNSTWK